MKRDDFTYTANKGGYMISYKGKPIGGAGTLSGGKGLRGKAVQLQISAYSQDAQRNINNILNGRMAPHEKEAIDTIDLLSN